MVVAAPRLGDPSVPADARTVMRERPEVGRFPFGGANRIRFEGYRDGSCPNLSPTPRVRLNKNVRD